jgi:hypothetical protein
MQLRFDCRECDEKLKKERGCQDRGLIPFETEDGRVFRCPLTLVTDVTWEYVEAYSFYRKSVLPNGQGYVKESKKYIDAMRILDEEYTKIENEQMEKIGKKR